MKIETLRDGTLNFKEVFNGIQLETESGNKIGICMRDNGFEIIYQGKNYEAKRGLISLDGYTLQKKEVEDKVNLDKVLLDMFFDKKIKVKEDLLDFDLPKKRYDISEDRDLLLKLENGTKGYFEAELPSNKNYFTPSENGNYRLVIDGDVIIFMSVWDLLEEPPRKVDKETIDKVLATDKSFVEKMMKPVEDSKKEISVKNLISKECKSKMDCFGRDMDIIQDLFIKLQDKYPFTKKYIISERDKKLHIVTETDVDDLRDYCIDNLKI